MLFLLVLCIIHVVLLMHIAIIAILICYFSPAHQLQEIWCCGLSPMKISRGETLEKSFA